LALFSQVLAALREALRRQGYECSGTPKAMRTAVESWRSTGRTSRATRTSETSTATPPQLTLLSEGSPANTSPKQQPERTEQMVGFGPSSPESSESSSPAGSSLRTQKGSVMRIAGSPKFSQTLPKWGSMRNGELFGLPILELRISEPEFGWLPTPTHTANQLAPSMMKHRSCRNLSKLFPDGELCLIFEWMMGFPIGYSDASELGTQSRRPSQSGSDDA
jgi:hypothetical protein